MATALGQISGAEQALALLSEPPSAADLASAEQAVATALGQISGAEQALTLLSGRQTPEPWLMPSRPSRMLSDRSRVPSRPWTR